MRHNTTECRVVEWLRGNIKEHVVHQFYASWCRNPVTNRMLPFDIYIPDLATVIEIDGPQHFNTIKRKWGSAKSIRQRDVIKMKCCYENGITIIRLPQEIVVKKNGPNWKYEITSFLSTLRFMAWSGHPIYICSTNEYEKHDKDFVSSLEGVSKK